LVEKYTTVSLIAAYEQSLSAALALSDYSNQDSFSETSCLDHQLSSASISSSASELCCQMSSKYQCLKNLCLKLAHQTNSKRKNLSSKLAHQTNSKWINPL
jgi:hypothetical protein